MVVRPKKETVHYIIDTRSSIFHGPEALLSSESIVATPFHLLPISWNGSWCLEVFNASTMVSSRGTVVGSMNRRETGFLPVTLINDFPAAQRSLFDKVITDVSGKIFDERLKDRLSNSNSNRVQSSNGGSNFVDQ